MGHGDEWVKEHGGRVKSFEIADDESLIGAELDYRVNYDGTILNFTGVTWIIMKVIV